MGIGIKSSHIMYVIWMNVSHINVIWMDGWMLVILCAGYHRSFTQVENRIPVFKTVFPYSRKKWVYSIQEDPCSDHIRERSAPYPWSGGPFRIVGRIREGIDVGSISLGPIDQSALSLLDLLISRLYLSSSLRSGSIMVYSIFYTDSSIWKWWPAFLYPWRDPH